MLNMELLQLGVLGPILSIRWDEDTTVQLYSLMHMQPWSHTGTSTKTCTHETVDTHSHAHTAENKLYMLIILYCTVRLSLEKSFHRNKKGEPGWYNDQLQTQNEKRENH